MPVTPFHFGIGLLGKGVAPARVSLSAFVASQIVIDCETAYFLFVVREWPVHRWAHTFGVGTLIGLGVGVAMWATAKLLWRGDRSMPLARELALLPSVAGGALGGVTHPLLDAIMHSDVRPLRPFLEGNPLLGVMTVAHLHLLCVSAAAVGAALLMFRRARTARGRGRLDVLR